MNATTQKLEKTRQNLKETMAMLAGIETNMAYSRQVLDLEKIAREHPIKEEQERMMHQVRQYRMLVPEIGHEEAYRFVFENGYRVR